MQGARSIVSEAGRAIKKGKQGEHEFRVRPSRSLCRPHCVPMSPCLVQAKSEAFLEGAGANARETMRLIGDDRFPCSESG